MEKTLNLKRLKEIFKDYNSNSFELSDAYAQKIDLHKQTNSIDIKLLSDKPVLTKDIIDFEKYLRNRFKLDDINIAIDRENNFKNSEEKEEYGKIIDDIVISRWKELLFLVCRKRPMAQALLKSSTVKINDNNDLVVTLSIKGKNYLTAKNFENGFSKFIDNLYSKKYKIEIEENISEDLIEKSKASSKFEEEKMVEAISKGLLVSENIENGVNKNTNSNTTNNKPSKNNSNPKIKEKAPENNDISVKENNSDSEGSSDLIYGRNNKLEGTITKIEDIGVDTGNCIIEGDVQIIILDEKEENINLDVKTRELKNGKILIIFSLFDGTSTIDCKLFSQKEKAGDIIKTLKGAPHIKVGGVAQFDPYSKEVGILCNSVVLAESKKGNSRADTAEEKRVELHLHTQMSLMDGISSTKDIIKRAMKWGMKSLAITDAGSVQAFPDAHKMLGVNNKDMKILYGVDAALVPDQEGCVFGSRGQKLEDVTFCVLDLETTGTTFRTEKITEIGIMKVVNGKVVDEFCEFVNPEKPIPQEVVDITHITDEMVRDCDTIDKVFPRVLDFIGDSVIVAHNADFDVGFLKYNAKQLGYNLDNTYLDTLRLAKQLYPDFKKYKLGIIAENLGIKVEVAHRALDDVDTTVKVLNYMMDIIIDKGAKTLDDIDELFVGQANYKKLRSYDAVILAKDYIGLRNLYKLISISHLHYFYRKPLILKSIYKKYSEGLIISSGNSQGELFQAIENGKDDEDLEEIIKDYDYLEIEPVENNARLIREGVVENEEGLRNINRKIVRLGEKYDKLVVATGDVRFLDPGDEVFRRILEAGQGFANADMQAPLYFKTTNEMLEEFSYLGEEKAYEVVVKNTNLISDSIEQISPISPEKCPPYINDCEKTIKEIAYNKAHELYGDPLPQIVEERLDKELNSIIKNGFSVMYIIAQKLVWKSNEDGYIVGSRGSVGSSFVANMTGITEVNSLPPHYRCPNCKYSDFTDYGVKNGFDLPDKECPNCGKPLAKDGIDIPFETFLGFNGDKEPDIDLNFSGEYQAKAHKYTEVIFGKGTTFKAGTVGTVAGKTAMGYVRKYNEERGIPANNSEIIRLASGCTGIKRTTGQHPGGIIVVPKGREIYEFTPVQHPADDPNSDIITTHFDYHSIDQNLLKLDILGHDDPTMIRFLYDITGIDPTKVPLDDKETMSIFSSTKALGVTPDQIRSEVGSYGVPEFGTKFVRGMLVDTKPKTFEELIRISGLSHGTDVWLNNAQDLINSGTITLADAICTRDDIMLYLIKMGLPSNTAFKIMESVRKGKVAKGKEGKWDEYVALMREHNVPEWYIDSCKKIKYMFPKAHAAAYVTNAFRIAWFKVHEPRAYYAAYFTIRADAFDSDIMCHGVDRVKNKMKEIELAGKSASKKDQDTYQVLEIVLEMYERGLNFDKIDLYESDPIKFKVTKDGLLKPPLNSIPGLGTVAAQAIADGRVDGEFSSKDDLRIRGKVGKATMEILEKAGCLEGMTESNQLSLFA